MFITGIFAFAVFAFPVHQLLPNSYYHISNPLRLLKVYKLLKVGLFKKALLHTLWRSTKQRTKHFSGKRSGIQQLRIQSRQAEFGHLIPFLLLAILTVYVVYINHALLATFIMMFNILGNLYPVLLQRHHRMRIQRLPKH